MKLILPVAALAAASGLWAATAPAAQDARGEEAPQGLVRIQPTSDFEASAWRDRLTQPDLDARERAFDEVVERARQERGAEEALETWSRGADELAWTARLALRELRRTGGALRPQTAPFRGDPFAGRFPSLGSPFGAPGDPFEAMRQRMERMLQEFHGGDPFGGASPFRGFDPFSGLELDLRGLPPGASSRSRSFELRRTPDGVEVKVMEDEGEGPVERTYRAPSLEELLQAHPELRDRFGARGLGDPAADPDGAPQDLPGLRRAGDRVNRTDRLGVYLDPQAEEGRLLVEAVEPGTIAAALRLRPGDVVLELNGREVASADDIRRALEVRFPDEEVRVLVRTTTGEEEELVWSPEE